MEVQIVIIIIYLYVTTLCFLGMEVCLTGRGNRIVRYTIWLLIQLFITWITFYLGEDYSRVIGMLGVVGGPISAVALYKDSPKKSITNYIMVDMLISVPFVVGMLIINYIYYRESEFQNYPMKYKEVGILLCCTIFIFLILKYSFLFKYMLLLYFSELLFGKIVCGEEPQVFNRTK